MAVHAHPDDECITTGGTLARYAADGAHVCLVTCTNGELGEIAELDDLDAARLAPRLGEHRLAELAAACSALGISDYRPLGHRDSGMDGTDGNSHPDAFMNRPLREVAGTVARIIDDVRPQVVVTYDDRGLYGHPDHIQAHRVTVAALERASWQADRLYYACVSRRRLVLSGAFSRETVDGVGTPDEKIAATLDVSAHLDAKIAAMRAHRTQYGTMRTFLELPHDVRSDLLATEDFVLAKPTIRTRGRFTDLFDGLDAR